MVNHPKIALVGYGSMGKEVEKTAKELGFIITDIFEIDNQMKSDSEYDFDVAIDFSYPDTVFNNVATIAKLNKNIVVGTTGWMNTLDDISQIVINNKIGLVYGSNFSIGMMIFFSICDFASKLANNFEQYDIMIHELHHKRKKDSPSGTALKLAEIILNNVNRKTEIKSDRADNAINHNELHTSSTRGGEITGTHYLFLDSFADTIELVHRAKNRTGLATGALFAADWIYQKKGIYEFSQVFNDYLKL